MATTNTNADTSYGAKWFQANLQETLKAALVAEKICQVDRSDGKYIWNPYGSAPTTTIQAIAGSYSAATYTSTDDTLTVSDEFICSNVIHDFEMVMQHGDILASRRDEMIASVATSIDKWVINNLCEDGTGTYSTPSGGFSAANITEIMANLISKVSGYANAGQGYFIVIEQQDLPGFIEAGASSGFNFADAWLNNGKMGSYMGVDIYVKPNATFVSDTLGTTTVTNAGHRVFGIKGITTYAAPRGVRYEEKHISGETGYEVVCFGYIGFRAWYQKKSLIIDITITS